ncbi:DNA repair protein [Synergistales bacterium]|nr:DNA repair protein [Synergistales bacterium]
MPTLDLNQITSKLNAEFAGDTRKLVFWYDDKAEFVDDIDTLEISGAKLHKLAPDNQFYTKYLLERQDTEYSYLIYAPFPKPDVRDNCLEDTLLYSRRFYADRASLLTADLRIDEKYKPVIQKYIKFFAAKDRTQRFYDLEIENFTKESIEIALMSVLCKTRTASFDEALRTVLTDDGFSDNKFLAEFEKYDLLEVFWRLCEDNLGYTDDKRTLERLTVSLFVTYTSKQLRGEMPQAWREFVSYKSGNIIAFLDSLMNSVLYRERYDEIAEHVAGVLNAKSAMEQYEAEALLDCDAFEVFDRLIIRWITRRLLDEDWGAKLGDFDIPAICAARQKKHFSARFTGEYQMLAGAHEIIQAGKYACPEDFKSIVSQYIKADWLIDSRYRSFYAAFDRLQDTGDYEKLRELVENIYTNEYLAKLIPAWNAALTVGGAKNVLPAQREFFGEHIKYSKEKVAVIISDALRYEVGRELFLKLQDDPNCKVKLDAMLGVLPSYTQLGMAALLPHKVLEITEDGRVLADGAVSDNLEKREAILQKALPNSRCVRFDSLPAKREQLREIFNGMDAVYVYHDQIDARGEKLATENEAFTACSEAVEEIFALIKRLSGSANIYHFIVTADHGFIYKRDKITESHKIDVAGMKHSFASRRFIIAEDGIIADGVASVPLGSLLGNGDSRMLSYPTGANVFKVSGGQNFVHGGSSPQEMILPLLTVKTERGHMETHSAPIALVSMVQKITNLITHLDFIQKEPVSNVVKAAGYKLYFISEDNEKISNECVCQADKKDGDSQQRIFRLRFNFKNKKYDSAKKYRLVAMELDEKGEVKIEAFRHDVIMDIAFADDFGF